MQSVQETHESGTNIVLMHSYVKPLTRGCRGFTGIAYQRAIASQVGKMVAGMQRGFLAKDRRPMKRTCLRLILLLVVVCMQTGCCWSHCPEPWKSAVEWHTPPYGSSGE